jgi:hypothetical protein
VHDTLRALADEHLIGRQEVEGVYVYMSAARAPAKAQLARRRALTVSPPAPLLPAALDAATVIEVLLAVIQKPHAAAAEIAAGLRARGIGLAEAQVEEVFRRYQVEKKLARSRSRRSRH